MTKCTKHNTSVVDLNLKECFSFKKYLGIFTFGTNFKFNYCLQSKGNFMEGTFSDAFPQKSQSLWQQEANPVESYSPIPPKIDGPK